MTKYQLVAEWCSQLTDQLECHSHSPTISGNVSRCHCNMGQGNVTQNPLSNQFSLIAFKCAICAREGAVDVYQVSLIVMGYRTIEL